MMANLDPESTNWISTKEQVMWFDRFKSIVHEKLTGIKFEEFKKFINLTHHDFIVKLLEQTGVICSDQYKQSIFLTSDEQVNLFKIFDLNHDNIIDLEEFRNLCEKWLHKLYKRNSAFIIVDVQNDFIDGSLALLNGPAQQDGAEIIDVINNILDNWKFDAIVYTQDWHPIDHIGFYDNLHLRKYRLKDDSHSVGNIDESQESVKDEENNNNNNHLEKRPQSRELYDKNTRLSERLFKYAKLIHEAKLFDVVLFDDGKVEQKLWPIHCVQNSWGAELHSRLKFVPGSVRIFKGTLSNIDAYSAFWDNMRLNETGLRQELAMRNIDDVFVCGLALDYCVASSALDSAKAGFKTYVVEDACRGLDHKEMEEKRKELKEQGIIIIDSRSLNYLGAKALRASEWTREIIVRKGAFKTN